LSEEVSEEVKEFAKEMTEKLRKETKMENIKVTAGPWKMYDVMVTFNDEKQQYEVDFYSALRVTDPQRLETAYNYAVGWIEGYEARRKKISSSHP